MENLKVVKSNELIRAQYKLSETEQQLLLTSIGKLDSTKTIEKNLEVKIDAREFAKFWNKKPSNVYRDLIDAESRLFERKVFYDKVNDQKNKITVKTRWISSVEYDKKNFTFTLKFADDILPCLMHLKKCFTKYGLEEIRFFKSTYSVRLFELLMQWKSKKKSLIIDVSDIRQRFGIEPSQYAKFKDFYRRCITPAIKDINAHSSIYVAQVIKHKLGRNISKLEFVFMPQKEFNGMVQSSHFKSLRLSM